MSINSSSSADLSILPPPLLSSSSPPPPPPFLSSSSSNASSLHLFWITCSRSEFGSRVFHFLSAVNLLLLPLDLLILRLGFVRWRRRRCEAAASLTPSDLFTFHSIVMRLGEWLGAALFFGGSRVHVILAGHYVCAVAAGGQSLFHLLTCGERYLAVVHPVAYHALRPAARARVRDVSCGCVWAVSAASLAACYAPGDAFEGALYVCTSLWFLGVAAFCSGSVLWALRRPGPAGGGPARARGDRAKRRAFHTIAVIMAALLLRFGGNLVGTALFQLRLLERCTWITGSLLLDLPSGLVLPLLFLHRLGKLPRCRRRVM